MGAGHATILATALPNIAVAHSELALINIVMPRAMIAAKTPNLEDRLARPLDGDPIALRLLGHYASTIFGSNEDQLTPALMRTAAEHMCDLVVLALGGTRDDVIDQARRGGMRAGRAAAIKAEISKRYRDPALTAERVGAMQGVGGSYVRRILEHEGTTFSSYLLNCRLEMAYRDLVDPRLEQYSITDLALSSGFVDQSWFNRTFRRRFGETPSAIRAEFRVRASGER